jgi:ATP-dependent helicase/DNAse subunit B
VTSFPRLFEEVGRACGAAGGTELSRMQRLWLARAATMRTPLRQLSRSSRQEGFAPALEALISDLQTAGLDARSLAAAADELADGSYEAEITALLAGYEELRDGLGLTDQPTFAARAIAALRSDPASWRGRPVFLYGFDDLARQQVELVGALGAAAEVTIAITFELDRPALAARAELRGVLVEELGAEFEPPLPRREAIAGCQTLHHLERHLFETDPPAVPPDGSLRLLEGAGERGEAELIGRQVARLLADGTDPDEIAIAVRSPDRSAALMARVLSGLGIPVAPEARVPLAATATGSALLQLLAIAGTEGTAADVIAFLRGPARARPRSVDWLERRVLRGRMSTAAEALESWQGDERGHRVWELDALAEAGRDPAELAQTLARIAADIAERPHLRSGVLPSSGPAIELRAAAEVARTLTETADLGAHAPAADELAELLGHVRVPLWRGPTEGRIRILSPYRLRATRVRHLFVAGLMDGSFPARGGSDPLLPDERRAELGLPSRSDPAQEERYLFYSCVSRPESRLYLSYPASDESGTPVPRSPFVDEIRSLLSPGPTTEPADDEVEAAIATRSGLDRVVPDPEEASTPRELARALAALGTGAAKRAASLELPTGVGELALAEIDAAATALVAAREPGPLTNPDVLAELGAERPYGASTIEEYDTCPYRWFVGHELNPQPLGPDPEPLEDGGLVHEVLERLYREPPGSAEGPTTDDVGAWVATAGELIRTVAAERGWDLEQPQARIRMARFEAVLARFLRRDAEGEGPLKPDRELLEASFGRGENDQYPAADLGGFSLHGRIDRIDVSADGKALIRDYKLSSKVTFGKNLIKEGKLQMPLYLLAARGFGVEPIGGLYSPLAATREDRPRGLMNKDYKGSLIPAETRLHVATDFLPPEEFDEILEGARERAHEIVAGMRGGAISRSPRNDQCPKWCALAPICRIERGAAVDDPEAEEDETA